MAHGRLRRGVCCQLAILTARERRERRKWRIAGQDQQMDASPKAWRPGRIGERGQGIGKRGASGHLLVTLLLPVRKWLPGPWSGGGSVARELVADERGLTMALQPGVAPLGKEGEVLPLVPGAAGAGGLIGEHLLLVVTLAQVDHGGGPLGLVVEVGGEGDIVAALVVHRRRHPQLAALDLQFGDPYLVALFHALAQVARLPAVVAPLDPAALDGALRLLLLGGEPGHRLGIEG